MSTFPSGSDDRREMLQLLSQYDAPAYARRARGVELAEERLLDRCRQQREEWLDMVRLRLATLYSLAGTWSALTPWLDEEQLDQLQEMHTTLKPRLRVPVPATQSARQLRDALEDLIGSLERFNRRWLAFLAGLDVSLINQLREGYNRYYVLEKECALRNSHLARHGFQPLPPLTLEDITKWFPPLFVPRPRMEG